MLLHVRTMLAGVACAVVTLTGCSASVEVGDVDKVEEVTISEKDLETGITDALEETVGQRPDSVDCPGSVKAEAGESIRCELTAGPDRVGLTATVKSYKDGKAQYDVKVDDELAN